MDQLMEFWNWFNSPTALAIFVALFALSEALASIPAIKSNSIFQLVYQLLAKLAKKDIKPVVVLLLVLGLSGCAGSMLNGRVCTLATDQDAQAFVEEIAKEAVDEKDQEAVRLGLKAAKITAQGLCEAQRYQAK